MTQETPHDLRITNPSKSELSDEMRTARLMDHFSFPFLQLDTELRIVSFSSLGGTLWGLSEQDVGKPLGEFSGKFPSNTYSILAELAKAVLAKGKIAEVEVQMLESSWYLLKVAPIKDGRENVAGLSMLFVDISHSRAKTKEAVQYKEFIERMAQASPNFMYVFDLEKQKNIFSNNRIENILGYSPEEIQAFGDNLILELTHPDDIPTVLENYTALEHLQPGQFRVVEYRMQHRDGHWVWLESSDSVFWQNDAGKVIQTLGIAQDISVRKQVESERVAAKAFSDRISQTSPGVIHIYNLEHQCFTYVSPGVESLFGIEEADFLANGRDMLRAMTHPNDQTHVENEIRNLIQLPDGALASFEFRIQEGENEWIWIKSWVSVFSRDQAGIPWEILTTSMDITDVKERKEELRKFKTTVDRVDEGIIWIDKGGKVTYVNEAAEAIFLKKRNELIGVRPWEFGLVQDEGECQILMKYLEGVNSLQHTVELALEGRESRQIEVLCSYLPYESETYIVAIVRDITARIKQEGQLRKKEELERINKELEQFTYVASHDLQEPLRTISNHATLLLEEYEALLDEDGKKSLNYLYGATQRMSNLVKGLLEYSRTGKNAGMKTLDCKVLIEQVCGDLEQVIKEKQAKVEVGELPTIQGMEEGVRSIFQNLISNALKFSGQKEKPNIQVSCESGPRVHTFSVKDNGIGIPKKHQDKIFRIFQRLHRKDAQGYGIGLAQCKRIMELHSGNIWVESEEGKGSTFYVAFPR